MPECKAGSTYLGNIIKQVVKGIPVLQSIRRVERKAQTNNVLYLCNPRYRYKVHAWFAAESIKVWGGSCRSFKTLW